jgi:hypothetical protein
MICRPSPFRVGSKVRTRPSVVLGVTICAIAWTSTPALCQTRTIADLPQWAQVRQQTPRKALVIGVGQYDYLTKLAKPERDGEAMASKLTQLGFSVVHPTAHLDRGSILQAMDQFMLGLGEGDIALVYFSGHGVERGGANYLIPADVRQLDPGREGLIAINVEYVLGELEKRKASVAIVILDACRDDPFPAIAVSPTVTGPKGLAPMAVDPTGMFIGFAAAPRTPAFSGLSNDPPDAPSIFTRFLIDVLPQEGKSLFWIWSRVGNLVYDATSQQQKPWQNSSLFPEIKFKPGQVDISEAEKAWIELISVSSALTLQRDLEGYLEIFPDSPFAPTARAKLRASRMAFSMAAADRDALSSGERFAQIAMQTRLLTGSVTPSSYISSSADWNLVTASTDVVVRERPTADAPLIRTLTRGTAMKALALPDVRGWLSVRLRDGRAGYIPAVSENRIVQRAAARVTFQAGKSVADSHSLSILAPILTEAKQSGGRVNIDLGNSSEELPDRALTTSYLRALSLRSALVGSGVRPDQIQVRLNRASLGASDDAAVTLNN